MLNWLTRYAPAVAALEEAGPLGSVLDVGCGTHGLACVRPELPFVGFEIEYHGSVVDTMVGFQGPPGPLPWKDAAFDTVLCLDALEHVPRPDRAGFVAELGRVAARRLLIACPSTASQRLDDTLRRGFGAGGSPNPSWLAEHYQHRLPEEAEVEAFVRAVPGFEATRVPMTNGLLCTMAVLADLSPVFGRDAMEEYASRRAEWSELFANARVGPSLRVAWMLEREPARPAAVRTDDLAGTAVLALTPDAEVRWAGGAPVSPPRALDTDAGRRLWLSPDWARPETWVEALAAYVGATGPADDVCLCLDATAPGLTTSAVAELVGAACERLGGDRPYGDVLLVEGPAILSGTIGVTGATDVRAALGHAAGQAEALDPRVAVLVDELRTRVGSGRPPALSHR